MNAGQFSARASQPGGFDANQRALLDRVSLYLSTIQTLVGDFVQVGPDGARTEGQLFLQKPGKIRFEYKPPSVIEVVADGSSVVVRDRKLATQDLYPLSQTPLRYLLAERIDLLRDTNVVTLAADDVFVTVTIEEKQQFVGTSRLMMMFGAKDLQLRQWTVTDPQGFDTTVAVYNLDGTKKPDPRNVRHQLRQQRTASAVDSGGHCEEGFSPTKPISMYYWDCFALSPRNDDTEPSMKLTVTTWNINSVRLRIDNVAKFIKSCAAGCPVPAGNQVS